MSVKTFNVSFPKELANLIDAKAAEQFGSRSDFLRAAALKYLEEDEKRRRTIAEFKELMEYGKTFAANSPFKDEEEVANYIRDQRRQKEVWRQQRTKNPGSR